MKKDFDKNFLQMQEHIVEETVRKVVEALNKGKEE